MRTDLAAPKALLVASILAGAADACQERNSGRFSPSNPAPPTRSSSRRDQPSQVRTGRPGMVSIDVTPWSELYHARCIIEGARQITWTNQPPKATYRKY